MNNTFFVGKIVQVETEKNSSHEVVIVVDPIFRPKGFPDYVIYKARSGTDAKSYVDFIGVRGNFEVEILQEPPYPNHMEIDIRGVPEVISDDVMDNKFTISVVSPALYEQNNNSELIEAIYNTFVEHYDFDPNMSSDFIDSFEQGIREFKDDLNITNFVIGVDMTFEEAFFFGSNVYETGLSKCSGDFSISFHTKDEVEANKDKFYEFRYVYNPNMVHTDINKSSIVASDGFYGDNFYADKSKMETMHIAAQSIVKGRPLVIMAIGPSGSGKTSWARSMRDFIADMTGIEIGFLKVDCQAMAEGTPEDWFVRMRAYEGSTIVENTEFGEVLKGNVPHVILLDEINRVPADIANPLLPVLDDTYQFSHSGIAHKIVVPHIFIQTANIGTEFTGVFSIDTAFLNRTDLIERFGYLSENVERQILANSYPGLSDADVSGIVTIVSDIRSAVIKHNLRVDVTTRTIKKIGNLVDLGFSIRQSIDRVIINPIIMVHGHVPKDVSEVIGLVS